MIRVIFNFLDFVDFGFFFELRSMVVNMEAASKLLITFPVRKWVKILLLQW